jgi:hypothetical protein
MEASCAVGLCSRTDIVLLLLVVLCRLLQEQEAWMQLLAQYNAMTGSTPAAAAEGAGSPAAAGMTSPQQQEGTEGAEVPGGAATPAGKARALMVTEVVTNQRDTASTNK